MSTCGCAGRAAPREQLGQPVQRLRAEHHVDVGRALDDRRAFLARDAAADARSSVRVARASGACTRPRSANTFSCAFSRTEQVLKTMRSASSAASVGSKPSAAREHVGDLVRVVLVHLAAEGAEVELARHACRYSSVGCAASCGVRIQTRCTLARASSMVLDQRCRRHAVGTHDHVVGRRGSARPQLRSLRAAVDLDRHALHVAHACRAWRHAGMVRSCARAAPARRRQRRSSRRTQHGLSVQERGMVANQGLEPRTNGL